MAPKPLHQLGSTKPHGNGWRAVVHLKHGEEYCPLRTTRCAAEADLARIRGATVSGQGSASGIRTLSWPT